MYILFYVLKMHGMVQLYPIFDSCPELNLHSKLCGGGGGGGVGGGGLSDEKAV